MSGMFLRHSVHQMISNLPSALAFDKAHLFLQLWTINVLQYGSHCCEVSLLCYYDNNIYDYNYDLSPRMLPACGVTYVELEWWPLQMAQAELRRWQRCIHLSPGNDTCHLTSARRRLNSPAHTATVCHCRQSQYDQWCYERATRHRDGRRGTIG